MIAKKIPLYHLLRPSARTKIITANAIQRLPVIKVTLDIVHLVIVSLSGGAQRQRSRRPLGRPVSLFLGTFFSCIEKHHTNKG